MDREKKEKLSIALIIVFIVGGTVIFLVTNYLKQQRYDITAENENTTQAYKEVEYEGETYKFNPRIDTFLYIGVDTSEGLDGETDEEAGQADTIVLFVMNKDSKVLTGIFLSRDTMTDVGVYDVRGNYVGTVEQHLGYAYTFGYGGKTSCENTVNAVSNLLNGIPIEEYVATDVGSIEAINDIVGGVTVTVPNSDLEDVNEEFKEGNVVTLTSENVETFVRYRDTSIDFTNEGRIERQQAYVGAYMPKLEEVIEEDVNGLWDRFLEFEDTVITSITKSEYVDIANNFATMNLDEIVYYSPEGENVVGDTHDEFYVDEDALLEKMLEIFYVKS